MGSFPGTAAVQQPRHPRVVQALPGVRSKWVAVVCGNVTVWVTAGAHLAQSYRHTARQITSILSQHLMTYSSPSPGSVLCQWLWVELKTGPGNKWLCAPVYLAPRRVTRAVIPALA